VKQDQQGQRVQLRLMLRRTEVLKRAGLQAAELGRQQRRLRQEVEDLPRVVRLRVVADVVREPRRGRIVAEQPHGGEDHAQLAGRRHPHDPVERIGVRDAEEAVLAAAHGVGGDQFVAVLELGVARRRFVHGHGQRPVRPDGLARRSFRAFEDLCGSVVERVADLPVQGDALADPNLVDADRGGRDQHPDARLAVQTGQLAGEPLLLREPAVEPGVREPQPDRRASGRVIVEHPAHARRVRHHDDVGQAFLNADEIVA
jgi:hypothetical protein